MWIIVPRHSDYVDSADALREFFCKHDLAYCVYGSFLVPAKVKPGLSDIDVIVAHKWETVLFPYTVSKELGRVQECIKNIWIPLQINKVTIPQLRSKFLSPDGNYLEEVSRGLRWEYVSPDFKGLLDQVHLRDPDLDDSHMARYFFRKITKFPTDHHIVERILAQPISEMTSEDQKKLWSFWDGFKKMITFIALPLRIRDRVSYFSRPNSEIVQIFQESYGLQGVDTSEYTKDMESIKNISDWYLYLKNGWLEKIEGFYMKIFTPFIGATGDFE